MKLSSIIVLIMIYTLTGNTYGGTLKRMEESATKSQGGSSSSSSSVEVSSSTTKKRSGSSSSSSLGDDFAGRVLGALLSIPMKAAEAALAYGGESSMDRYNSTEPTESDPLYRKPGDGLLPTVKIDAHFLLASDDITGQQSRVELGYGMYGFSHTTSRLFEKSDSLTMSYNLFHYRMSFSNRLSWDLALGEGKLNGDDEYSGAIAAMPIRFRFSHLWYGEYFPVWSSYNGGAMAEHQFSINWQEQFFGIYLGYKEWITDDTEVKGFFLGGNLVY